MAGPGPSAGAAVRLDGAPDAVVFSDLGVGGAGDHTIEWAWRAESGAGQAVEVLRSGPAPAALSVVVGAGRVSLRAGQKTVAVAGAGPGWHHGAVVVEGSQVSLVVDGRPVGSRRLHGFVAPASLEVRAGSVPFEVAVLAIYPHALAPDQIEAHWALR